MCCSGEPVAWNGEMSITLWEVSVYHLLRIFGRSVCSSKVVEDFWGVHSSCVMAEGRIVDSNMNGFSSLSANSFAVLVYYLELGDVGLDMVDGKAVFVNWPGDMTNVFFYSILQPSAGCSYVGKVAIFS